MIRSTLALGILLMGCGGKTLPHSTSPQTKTLSCTQASNAFLRGDFRYQAYASMGIGGRLRHACYDAGRADDKPMVTASVLTVHGVDLGPEADEAFNCEGTVAYAGAPLAVHTGDGEMKAALANVVQQLTCSTVRSVSPRCKLGGILECEGPACPALPEAPEPVVEVPESCQWVGMVTGPKGPIVDSVSR